MQCPGWNDESMRIVVLSDTHAPRFWKRCPPAVAEHLSTAELIMHAGDVCVASALEELSAYAPSSGTTTVPTSGPGELKKRQRSTWPAYGWA